MVGFGDLRIEVPRILKVLTLLVYLYGGVTVVA